MISTVSLDSVAVRYDIGSLRKPVKTAQGFMRADAYLSRSGIYEYQDADGSVLREYRDASEVFSQEALDSFSMVPVTDGHPPDLLTAANAREYARGHLGEAVSRDGDKVRAALLITDAGLIAKMEKGTNQVSCGYTCDVAMEPGEWQGQKYDAVQRNIRGNHLAVLEQGRAGPGCCVRMDYMEKRPMANLKIDGVDFETSAEVVSAVAKVQAQGEKNAARADAAEAEVVKERQVRKDIDASFPARVKARVALEKTAASILGDVKVDEMSDKDIKLAVVAKVSTPIPADKKDSEAYVDGRFDAAVAQAEKSPLADARKVIDAAVQSTNDIEGQTEKARLQMVADKRDAWKQPIPGARTKAG